MKAFLKFTISIILLLTILGLSLNLVVNNSWLQKKILAKALVLADQYTDLSINVEDIFLNFLTLSLNIKDLEISDKDTHEVFVKLNRGSASFSFTGFLFARVDIAEVRFDGLYANLREKQLGYYLGQISASLAKNIPSKELNTNNSIEIPVNLRKVSFKNTHLEFGTDSLYKGNTLEFLTDIEDLTAQSTSNGYLFNLVCSKFTMKNNNFVFFDDTAIVAQGDFEGGNFNFEKIHISSPVNDIVVMGSVIQTSANNSQANNDLVIKLNASIAKGDFSLLGAFLDIFDTYGEVKGEALAEIIVPLNSNQDVQLNIEVDAGVSKAILYGFDLLESKAKLTIDMNKIVFRDVKLMNKGNDLGSAQGDIAFKDKGDISFIGSLEKISLSELFRALGIQQSVINADLSAKHFNLVGSTTPFHLDINSSGQITKLKLPVIGEELSEEYSRHSPSCNYDLNLLVQSDKLNFDGSHLSCFSTLIDLGGDLYFDAKKGLKLRVSSANFDLTTLGFILGNQVQGVGTLDTKIEGPYQDFFFNNHLELNDLNVYGMKFYKGIINLTLGLASISWDNISLKPTKKSDEILLSDGNLIFDKDLTFYTKIRGSKVSHLIWDIPKLNTLGSKQLNLESTSISGEIYGPILKPLLWRGDADFLLKNVAVDEQVFSNSVIGHFSGTTTKLKLEFSEIASGNVNFNGLFTLEHKDDSPLDVPSNNFLASLYPLGLKPEDNFSLKFATASKGNSPGNLLSSLSFIEVLRKYNLQEATVDLALSVSGHANTLSGALDGSLTTIIMQGNSWPGIRFKAFLNNDDLDFLGHFSSNALNVRFKTSLSDPNRPYFIFASATNLDLRYLLGAQFANNPTNFVYLTGDTQLEGSMKTWEHSRGWINLKEFWFSLNPKERRKIEGHLVKPLQFTSDSEGWVEKDNTPIIVESEEFKIEILPSRIELGKKLNIALKSRLNLENIPIFIPSIENASGEIIAQGNISGNFSDPEINIDIKDVAKNSFNLETWKPISLSIGDIRPPLKDVNIHATVEKDKIVLHNFFAKKGHGYLKATGKYFFREEDRAASNIDIQVSNAKIIYPVAVFKSFETDLSGHIALNIGQVPIDVSGELIISKARNTRDFNIRSEIISALRTRKYVDSGSQEPPLANLNLKISCDEGLTVTTRNINARLSADLFIKGTDKNPSALGNIEIVRGRFLYKRDFDITRGMVTFDNPNKIEPIIDLVAESEVSPYRIFLTIVGEASNPTVELSIDPTIKPDGSPISVVDILVLLSRGKFPANNALSTDASEAISSEALSLLIGQIEQPVEKLIELSGQDVVKQVYIDTYVSEETGQTGIKLALPLNITKNLDVIVSTQSTASESSRLGVSSEYSLHNNVALSADLEGIGQAESKENQLDGSMNIKFRFNFP